MFVLVSENYCKVSNNKERLLKDFCETNGIDGFDENCETNGIDYFYENLLASLYLWNAALYEADNLD